MASLVALYIRPARTVVRRQALFVAVRRAEQRDHLTPGARTIDWLQATFAPLDDGVAVAITVGIRFCCSSAPGVCSGCSSAVGRSCSCRSQSLPPRRRSSRLRRGTASRSPHSSLLWPWCGRPAARSLAAGTRTRRLVGAAVWVAAGLAFHEQSAAIVPWLFTLTWVLPPNPIPDGARSAVDRAAAWPVSAAYGALLVAYGVAYVAGPFDHADGGEAFTVSLVLAMAGRHLLDGLATGLLGGPGAGQRQPLLRIADAPRALAVLSLAVFVGLFVSAALRNCVVRAAASAPRRDLRGLRSPDRRCPPAPDRLRRRPGVPVLADPRRARPHLRPAGLPQHVPGDGAAA